METSCRWSGNTPATRKGVRAFCVLPHRQVFGLDGVGDPPFGDGPSEICRAPHSGKPPGIPRSPCARQGAREPQGTLGGLPGVPVLLSRAVLRELDFRVLGDRQEGLAWSEGGKYPLGPREPTSPLHPLRGPSSMAAHADWSGVTVTSRQSVGTPLSRERGVRTTRRKSIRLTEGDSPRRPWAGTRYGLVVRHPISQAIPQSQWGCACLQGPLSPPKR